MWRVIDKYVMSMPSEFVQAKLKYQEAKVGGREYKRSSYCLESMMEPMGMTLGRLYVDANFDESTKTTVRSIFKLSVYEGTSCYQGSGKFIVTSVHVP